MQAHDSEPIRARKTHICILCDEPINAGDFYLLVGERRDKAHALICPEPPDPDTPYSYDDRLQNGWDMIHACETDDTEDPVADKEKEIVYKW